MPARLGQLLFFAAILTGVFVPTTFAGPTTRTTNDNAFTVELPDRFQSSSTDHDVGLGPNRRFTLAAIDMDRRQGVVWVSAAKAPDVRVDLEAFVAKLVPPGVIAGTYVVSKRPPIDGLAAVETRHLAWAAGGRKTEVIAAHFDARASIESVIVSYDTEQPIPADEVKRIFTSIRHLAGAAPDQRAEKVFVSGNKLVQVTLRDGWVDHGDGNEPDRLHLEDNVTGFTLIVDAQVPLIDRNLRDDAEADRRDFAAAIKAERLGPLTQAQIGKHSGYRYSARSTKHGQSIDYEVATFHLHGARCDVRLIARTEQMKAHRGYVEQVLRSIDVGPKDARAK